MSIFKRIRDLFTDGKVTDSSDERDRLSVPSSDVLNEWLHTLSEDTKARGG